MNQVAIRKDQNAPKMMLLELMADRYSLRPEQFRDTVRATCGLAAATPEQVAAFLIVANTYNLNPITKEIYAFPAKGGGIVPIVSIDGWVNLVNSNPQCDGFNFEMEHDDAGKLVSCTCTMHRKDRTHPVVVTEYLDECKRGTEPWKMQHRMLRHKSMIQAARYAFGFAGIYDEDEGRVIAESVDVTPRPRVPSPSEVIEGPHGSDKYAPGDIVQIDGSVPEPDVSPDVDLKKPDPISIGKAKKKSALPDIQKDYEGFVNRAIDLISHAEDGGALETLWNAEIAPFEKAVFPPDWTDLVAAYDKQQEKFKADE